MIRLRHLLFVALAVWGSAALVRGGVVVDVEAFGESLGGWEGKKGKLVEYEMADNRYRTFRPDITPTPDGGLFISLRIDHIRGIFASDDHASLELTVDPEGRVTATRSSISVQGKRITSDVIAGGVRGAGNATPGLTPAETVISVGADLVANLTEKLSRETKVEPGRVSFPAVVKHNFNLLYQSIAVKVPEPPAPPPQAPGPEPSPLDEIAVPAADDVGPQPFPPLESLVGPTPAAAAESVSSWPEILGEEPAPPAPADSGNQGGPPPPGSDG